MTEHERFDGNAEQVRLIAAQIAEAMSNRQGGLHDDIEQLKKELDHRIDSKIDAAVTKMKF